MDFEVLKREIAKVNLAFYNRVYKDDWLKLVFRDVTQERIEMQQTDFMLGAYGGPKNYSGRSPSDAHPHVYIDEEMWQLREKYLKEAFVEADFPEELRSKWIKIDEAFKEAIIKKSPADCKGRYAKEEIIYHPNPAQKKTG